MKFSKKELAAVADALIVARQNWHDSWQYGHLTEKEEEIYQIWLDLRERWEDTARY